MRKKPQPRQVHPTDPLAGNNPRHEVAGCPTGVDPLQEQAPQREGGGGAPGTGAVDPSPRPAPGEGISEQNAAPPDQQGG